MKPDLRIRGLVRFSKQVREALARSSDRDYWREQIWQALATVDQALRQHGLQPDDLPTPTRRAYGYLSGLDFGDVGQPPGVAGAVPPAAPKTAGRSGRKAKARSTSGQATLRFNGIQRELDEVVSALDDAVDGRQSGDLEPLAQRITDYSSSIERAISARQASAAHLTEKTRAARGWFAFLASDSKLQAYVGALRTARACVGEVALESGQDWGRVVLQFRPQGGLYRLYRRGVACELRMPTAMICLDADCYRELIQHAFRLRGGRERLMTALGESRYQSVQAELESLAGLVENLRGQVHDLGDSFLRVNRQFFGQRMARPRLCWSGRLTHRKLGHYDPVRDTIMISSTLDSARVPVAALDFVMFHELLHKQHGTQWRGGRAQVHTSAFRRDEQRYPQKDAIEALLGRLCVRQKRVG